MIRLTKSVRLTHDVSITLGSFKNGVMYLYTSINRSLSGVPRFKTSTQVFFFIGITTFDHPMFMLLLHVNNSIARSSESCFFHSFGVGGVCMAYAGNIFGAGAEFHSHNSFCD